MPTLWQCLQRGGWRIAGAHGPPPRTCTVARAVGEPQALHIPSQGDTLDGPVLRRFAAC